jgi:glycosyltransferase involved in cell wall biosynthesis
MNDEIKRLLCILSSMDAGGAETFLMKVYRAFDKQKYQMDFCVSNSGAEGFYDKEILSMGGKIHRSVTKTKKPIRSFISIMNIVKKNKYDRVLRVSQHSLSSLDLLAAKLGGARRLIYRSSNSNIAGGKINRLLHWLFKWLPKFVPTIKMAPSTEAAEFVFGKRDVRKGKVVIFKNAIALDHFLFNQSIRTQTRKEFKIQNKLVLGHIGRFSYQKNHKFLIDIFNEVCKIHPDAVLMLVGKGELEEDIKRQIKNYGLIDKVIFTGIRSDVANLLMAMDLFVFPSFFEGMPNVVIEAQATGLPCLISNQITREANITGLVNYLSITEHPKLWAEKIIILSKNVNRNIDYSQQFQKNGYDINLEIEKFIKLIFE